MGERLVAAAVGRIERQGMTVGLNHLSLEEVIAEAGVSRATAYRHFPSKSHFLREVLTTVVRSTRLEAESAAQVEDLLALVADRRVALRSEQGRRDVFVEALRRAADADVARVAASARWRTYLALHATARSLPDGELRSEVLAALADTEARFTAQRAAVYTRLAGALGYRLVAPLAPPEGFAVMADAAGALMTGLVVRSAAADATRAFRAAAFGSTEVADWTWAAHHLVGIVLGHLEPDPGVVWDDARLAGVPGTVEEMVRVAAELRPQP